MFIVKLRSGDKMQEYKPSRGEIAREFWQQSKQNASEAWHRIEKWHKDNTLEGPPASHASEVFLAAFAIPLIVPYVLPSAHRIGKGLENFKNDDEEALAAVVATLAGTVCLVGEIGGYAYACYKGHWETLAIPVLTNIASFSYEKWMKAKNNIIERNSKAIDNVVEEQKLP